MSRHKVEICGVNTANIKVLNDKETKELFQKIKTGDLLAREELINGNLKLVLSILKKFYNKVDNLDDLFQVGCLGLVKAIDNFDTSYDVKLSTYACPMILGEIKRYLRDNSSLRIARSIKDIAYKTLKLKEELMDSDGVEPTNAEVAKILDVSEKDIVTAVFPGWDKTLKIKITKICYKQAKSITDDDAKREGFLTKEGLLNDLKGFYPNMDKWDRLYYYRFELV